MYDLCPECGGELEDDPMLGQACFECGWDELSAEEVDA